jgi:hypothetical protein
MNILSVTRHIFILTLPLFINKKVLSLCVLCWQDKKEKTLKYFLTIEFYNSMSQYFSLFSTLDYIFRKRRQFFLNELKFRNRGRYYLFSGTNNTKGKSIPAYSY